MNIRESNLRSELDKLFEVLNRIDKAMLSLNNLPKSVRAALEIEGKKIREAALFRVTILEKAILEEGFVK